MWERSCQSTNSPHAAQACCLVWVIEEGWQPFPLAVPCPALSGEAKTGLISELLVLEIPELLGVLEASGILWSL